MVNPDFPTTDQLIEDWARRKHKHSGSETTNVPAGDIAAKDVQAAINELDDEKVAIAGDTMTGALTITPASGDVALTANKNIVLKAGQKLIFDGG